MKNKPFPQKLKHSHAKAQEKYSPGVYNDSQFEEFSSANELQINSLSLQND